MSAARITTLAALSAAAACLLGSLEPASAAEYLPLLSPQLRNRLRALRGGSGDPKWIIGLVPTTANREIEILNMGKQADKPTEEEHWNSFKHYLLATCSYGIFSFRCTDGTQTVVYTKAPRAGCTSVKAESAATYPPISSEQMVIYFREYADTHVVVRACVTIRHTRAPLLRTCVCWRLRPQGSELTCAIPLSRCSHACLPSPFLPQTSGPNDLLFHRMKVKVEANTGKVLLP